MATIKHLFHIAAPREQVYEAISTIEGLSNWWTAQTSGDSSPGGIIEFRFGDMGPDFKVVGLKEHEEVKWECTAGLYGWQDGIITISLDENEGKTRVRFHHEGLEGPDDVVAAFNFSWGRYLTSLRQYCQTGEGAAFGSKQYIP